MSKINLPYKEGDSFRIWRSSDSEPIKVHILYILPSHYDDKFLIVYKYYGKYKRWWHHCMEEHVYFDLYIKRYKNRLK